MKYLKSIILLLPLMLTSCDLSSGYKLNFNPPTSSNTAYEIFPEGIDGNSMKLDKPSYGGMKGLYGDDQSIYVARLSSNEEAMAFFNKYLQPQFKEQSSNFSGTINGQFYAKAESPSVKIFGWVNQNFAFMIKAADKKGLDQIIKAFDYIAPQ